MFFPLLGAFNDLIKYINREVSNNFYLSEVILTSVTFCGVIVWLTREVKFNLEIKNIIKAWDDKGFR